MLNERILANGEAIFSNQLYVCDGVPVVSEIGLDKVNHEVGVAATVSDLKTALGCSEVRSVNMPLRRNPFI